MYEKYYFELNKKIQEIIKQQNSLAEEQLLLCYFDSAKMVSGEIFNKYSLNQSVGNFALEHHQKIWNEIVSHICTNLSAEQKDIYNSKNSFISGIYLWWNCPGNRPGTSFIHCKRISHQWTCHKNADSFGCHWWCDWGSVIASFILNHVSNKRIGFILLVLFLVLSTVTGICVDLFLFHAFKLNYILANKFY